MIQYNNNNNNSNKGSISKWCKQIVSWMRTSEVIQHRNCCSTIVKIWLRKKFDEIDWFFLFFFVFKFCITIQKKCNGGGGGLGMDIERSILICIKVIFPFMGIYWNSLSFNCFYDIGNNKENHVVVVVVADDDVDDDDDDDDDNNNKNSEMIRKGNSFIMTTIMKFFDEN